MGKGFKKETKVIVLAGGCFDVLHPGHITFLEKAKKTGDKLIVLLESDEKVRILKGVNRPVHTQKERARILSALTAVDQIISLPFMKTDQEYDELVKKIKPDIIAVTLKALGNHHKRIAKLVGAKLKYVAVIDKYSTSKILNETVQ